jgi:hypothetical protein
MKIKKLRWGCLLYPQGSQNASTQMFQTNPWPQKYDGSQEPKTWLSDYLEAVKILGGSKATTMQNLQLHLSSATRSWLSKLPDDSISSWS